MNWKVSIDSGIEIVKAKLQSENKQLLYLVVSGSHAWGLERDDSDIDLRGVYQDSTINMMGLQKGKDNIEFSDGIYDIQMYEIEKFLRMLCNHNGNMVNLLWLPHANIYSFWVPWVGLSRNFLTKRLRKYYRGYAEGQRKRAMSERGGKALIYTYREMFSGLFTMRYGYVEHDFRKLWDTALRNNWYSEGLLDKYFPSPKQEVTDEGWHRFYKEWDKLCVELDIEADKSLLPDDYDGVSTCTKILQQVRLLNLFDGKLP